MIGERPHAILLLAGDARFDAKQELRCHEDCPHGDRERGVAIFAALDCHVVESDIARQFLLIRRTMEGALQGIGESGAVELRWIATALLLSKALAKRSPDVLARG